MEFNKKLMIALLIIIAVLIILIPVFSWVGGDGMEATLEAAGIKLPELFPALNLGPFQDYILAALIPLCMFAITYGVFYLIKRNRLSE